MAINKKHLKLHKETVRNLGTDELDGVVGGVAGTGTGYITSRAPVCGFPDPPIPFPQPPIPSARFCMPQPSPSGCGFACINNTVGGSFRRG